MIPALMRNLLHLFLCALVLASSGCKLKFGEDVELSGSDFDAAKLGEISTRTGLQFPPSANGVGYFYQGSGIDDALAAKIEIPEVGIADFMKNAVFTEGESAKPSIQIGAGKRWWNLDALTDRVDRKQNLPSAQFLEVTCGREGEAFVVYVSWMTT
jgi:hypothetical protein